MPTIELYKIKNELAPPIMDTVLNRRNVTYNFRNLQVSVRKKVNCFLWSGNFKLPCNQTMDTFVRRNKAKKHNKSF